MRVLWFVLPPRLLGVVNRSISDSDKSKYICHVLESESEGSKVCSSTTGVL